MNLLEETSNSLLNRREVRCAYPSAGNPGYASALTALAQTLGVAEDVVVIKRLVNSYGVSDSIVHAFVYHSVDAKQKFEPKPKAKKGGAS